MRKHPQQLSFLDALQDEVEEPNIQAITREKVSRMVIVDANFHATNLTEKGCSESHLIAFF